MFPKYGSRLRLRDFLEMQSLGLHPRPPELYSLGAGGAQKSVLTSPPSNSGAEWGLRTTASYHSQVRRFSGYGLPLTVLSALPSNLNASCCNLTFRLVICFSRCVNSHYGMHAFLHVRAHAHTHLGMSRDHLRKVMNTQRRRCWPSSMSLGLWIIFISSQISKFEKHCLHYQTNQQTQSPC